MNTSIYTNRLYLSYVLASAVLELFPNTQIVDRQINEIGFTYRFQFLPVTRKAFNKDFLLRIDDHMRLLLTTGFKYKKIEMMKGNAQEFSKKMGQFITADAISFYPYNIVPLIQFHSFIDICEEDMPVNPPKLAFKLLNFDCQDSFIEISVAAFIDKQDLKEFFKKFEAYGKFDLRQMGVDQKLFIQIEDGWVFLPKGKKLLDHLIECCRNEYQEAGFQFIENFSKLSAKKIFNSLFDIYPQYNKLVQFHARPDALNPNDFNFFKLSFNTMDQAGVICSEELFQKELISSLQFIEKTIKIFGFEYCLDMAQTQDSLERKALRFENELPKVVNYPEVYAQFYLYDNLGRRWQGPYLEGLRREGFYSINWSLISSFENFLALLLSKYLGELPFWLAPEQVRVIPIRKQHASYAQKVAAKLKRSGIRVIDGFSFEGNLAEKIYSAAKEKIPYIAILGDKEEKNLNQSEDWITVRSLNQKEQVIELNRWIELLVLENKKFEN